MTFEDAIKNIGDGVSMNIEVTPGARTLSIPDGYNTWRKRIEVKLTGPARKGKANDQLCQGFAALFNVPGNCVMISSGVTSSKKTVVIRNVEYEDVVEQLKGLIGS